ncbi:ABC transporter permease [Janthinobacterium agaricidamnosum]|uniref:ABC-2 type transporter family protein n=1 Tax=Janthinobacterium agaricidamnosum NBRC 102515 = DSM 9628 TaxID=1349767 RepID=W0V8V9_9BURK|nr:ABC transporter permease [Janthinobacterium agaricidamnosum]CDG83788.1 ABC-2 type transporter family protein [Janthinobacterium agaricidamnosum NBRC 102515 = DSM 9628]
MNWLTRLSQAFLLTWRAMLSDKGALTLLFAGGIIYSFFYPLPYTRESVQQVPVAVVDQDRSAMSRQITRYAMAHPSVKVVAVTPDLNVAQDLIWRNDIAGILFIPSGLQSKVLSGRSADVEVAGNGLYLMLNKAALNGLAEVIGTVSAGIEIKRLGAATPSVAQAAGQRQPIGVNPVPLFNVREGYGAYVVPGVATLIIQQTLLMAITMMFGTWFQRQTFPLARDGAAYCGMLLAYASVAAINCAYFFGFVFWWQDYPRGGNPGGLALLIVLFSLTLAAFGMLLGMLFRTRERGMQLLIATSMPVMFLAGLTWPDTALAPVLSWLRWLIPSTAGIQGFIALNQLGASLQEIRHELIGLIILLLVSVLLGLWRWSRPGRIRHF